MSSELRKDLKYLGRMTSPGGVYKRVHFQGDMTIDGDLDCLELKVNGVLNEMGSLKLSSGEINGSAAVKGNLDAEDINVNGELKVDGNVSVDKIKSNGRLIVKGDVSSEDLDLNGELKVSGKCEAETISLKGAFNINETLNVGEININLYGPSEAKEIGGSKINIQKGGADNKIGQILAAIFNPLTFYKAHLKVDTIEGDNISLEHTTANIVRGDIVDIGEGCEIDLVEYRTGFDKAPGASVLKHVKV